MQGAGIRLSGHLSDGAVGVSAQVHGSCMDDGVAAGAEVAAALFTVNSSIGDGTLLTLDHTLGHYTIAHKYRPDKVITLL